MNIGLFGGQYSDHVPTQYFNENPYFSDSVLKKEYRYIAPEGADSETPDADGITASALDFDWERDVVPEVCHTRLKED